MNKEQSIFLLTGPEPGQYWAYDSIEEMVSHVENPLTRTAPTIQKHLKEKGNSISIQGCWIRQVRRWTKEEIREAARFLAAAD